MLCYAMEARHTGEGAPRATIGSSTSLSGRMQTQVAPRPPFGLKLTFDKLFGDDVLSWRAMEGLFEGRAKLAGTSVEEAKQTSVDRDGLRRLGQPDDVAELACFLCTQEARHIQGTAISVDGGATSGVY